MGQRTTLNAEIDKIIEAKIASSDALHPTWITHAVCEGHKGGLRKGRHADFWRYGGYRTTRDAMTARIGKIAGMAPDKTGAQPTLPGFEYVQTYYVVKRDGEEIGVPTPLMTDAELDHLAERLAGMGRTCLAHATDVRRYKQLRAAEAAA